MSPQTDPETTCPAEPARSPLPAGQAGAAPSPDAGDAALERILRRETRASRAGASIVAAVLVIVFCVYALLETAVRAIGQPPWIVDPVGAAEWVIRLPTGATPLLLGASGAVLAMAGLFFFLSAVLPGRRARHVLPRGRAGVVVDDEVIAAALARRARLAANVAREQVMVTVTRRQVTVNIRPTSGVPLRREEVHAAVRAELESMALEPMPEVRINVAGAGVIGA